ncbi:hypothetical protein LTR85_000740 [Meristemomyces frigidus]|nr:hypothetical protein LTR85_000740 [Meristemomyces frigidus]
MPRELIGQSLSWTASTQESLGLQRKRSRAAFTCKTAVSLFRYGMTGLSEKQERNWFWKKGKRLPSKSSAARKEMNYCWKKSRRLPNKCSDVSSGYGVGKKRRKRQLGNKTFLIAILAEDGGGDVTCAPEAEIPCDEMEQ